jgi:hypothetical protein
LLGGRHREVMGHGVPEGDAAPARTYRLCDVSGAPPLRHHGVLRRDRRHDLCVAAQRPLGAQIGGAPDARPLRPLQFGRHLRLLYRPGRAHCLLGIGGRHARRRGRWWW